MRAEQKQGPRILHLYRRFRPDFTGDGIYYEQLIPLLSEKGSRHTILAFETAPPPTGDRATPAELEVIYLEAKSNGPGALLRWILQHRREYDVLHIHTHVDRLFLSYAAARLLGWKVIYSSTLADTLDELVETYRPLYRPLARRLFLLFHMFVGISPRLFSPNAGRRARLIPQGVRLSRADEDIRIATRRDLNLAPDEVVMLYLGSICLRKGIHALVETFVKLAAMRPKLRLILIGPVLEPEYGAAVFDSIERHGLSSRVTHIDFDPAPQRFYAAADIFAFASTDEGFGNVLLEAMSSGLPVVSRYLDGVTEAFVEHGNNGFLFSRAEAFEDAILALVDDPALRAQIGAAARESVQSRFALEDIASRYEELYRELTGGPGSPPRAPAMEQCVVARGPASLKLKTAIQPVLPSLMVVIDTESEFDWSKGVAADRGAVRSIGRLPEVQSLFERFGISPCYVLDYPVATVTTSSAIIRKFAERGAEIGAHLQPWSTPPFVESVDNHHAFPGNLPLWLQRQKLMHLCRAIEHSVGVHPRIFKAGRYGIGAATLALLESLQFQVDLSVAPGFDYSSEGGPDFSGFGSDISWFGENRRLLEIPTTSGFTGLMCARGPVLWRMMDWPILKQARLRGICDRTGLLSRVRLSPEGYGLDQMKALAREMIESGIRCLTLSFHSSSLQPGFTPYCAREADVDALLGRVESFLTYFRDELGGVPTSPLTLYGQQQSQSRKSA